MQLGVIVSSVHAVVCSVHAVVSSVHAVVCSVDAVYMSSQAGLRVSCSIVDAVHFKNARALVCVRYMEHAASCPHCQQAARMHVKQVDYESRAWTTSHIYVRKCQEWPGLHVTLSGMM